MSKKKYVAIGDIHGCLQSLDALLEKLNKYQNDYTFLFVGDYIDRGPDSGGVVDLLLAFGEEQECIFLRGNHEQMLLDAYYEGKLDLWLMNGGKSTLASYDATYKDFNIPESHLDFYKQTLMYYDTPDYFFVHAGLSPAKTIEESLQNKSEIHEFLWERSHLNAFETPWEKTVIFGHTPRPHPIRKPNMIGIDTGCVYDSLGYGKLTAVLLPEEEFVQQICIDN